MSAKPKTTRRAPRSWMITALLASLAVAYVAFIFGPAQLEISSLRGRVNERRQHILQASGLVVPIEYATQQLAKTKQVGTKWRESAPTASELSAFIASLSAEAKSAGAAIEQFIPHAGNDMQAIAQHGLTVHFQGDFRSTFDFIRRIEQMAPTVWLPSLRLNRDQNADVLRGELNLTIFVDRADSSD